jgi:hypothetical protein
MPKQKKLLPWFWPVKPKPNLPNLTDDQKSQIPEKVRTRVSAKDWEKIELARRIYHDRCRAKSQAPEYADFARRLMNFADGAATMLGAFGNGQSPYQSGKESIPITTSGCDLWDQLDISKMLPFDYSNFLHILDQLERRARLVIEQTKQLSLDAWENDWNGFIDVLALVFEQAGLRPTAAKSSRAKNPKPSPFVAFVWEVVNTLPPEIREHVHSREAMAKAVANALALRRSPTAQATGPAAQAAGPG